MGCLQVKCRNNYEKKERVRECNRSQATKSSSILMGPSFARIVF